MIKLERQKPSPGENLSSFDESRFKQALGCASRAILFGKKPITVLTRLVMEIPQEQEGRFDYLISSGTAVELYTSKSRRHRDIDLVMVNGRLKEPWHAMKIDVRTSSSFWGQLCFSDEFLISSAKKIPHELLSGHKENGLWLVHPAVIIVQKTTNHKGLIPREKDDRDVSWLFEFYREGFSENHEEWQLVAEYSISRLPDTEQEVTRNRIKDFESKHNLTLLEH